MKTLTIELSYVQRRVLECRVEKVSSHPLRTVDVTFEKYLRYRKIKIIFAISLVDLVGIDVHIVIFLYNIRE